MNWKSITSKSSSTKIQTDYRWVVVHRSSCTVLRSIRQRQPLSAGQFRFEIRYGGVSMAKRPRMRSFWKEGDCMAIISCPDCEGRISGKSSACIKCGFPLDEFTAVFSWGMLLTSISRFILALDGFAIGVVFFIRGIFGQDYTKAPGTYLDILKTTE